ncbi:hypothetical protein lacNasYZ03_14710 [Lactobacillus nasalidis]|uniref:Uncharacterized protein n=1 Tax=Lactobacillus nasalidis TaxID=2797258 RepID=A0ABQ3W8X0_9LACO|nr:hypothetical protein lacNasYZ01_16010 [Lactobacillus nasalidis]GHV98885.1 hypothetical protein lacNasYZ02_03150 [Lactobacillus nasalidis]GHW01784.1 hypothetical protein lacNasYZ03_14710 [Lactobacillus nasalidis]
MFIFSRSEAQLLNSDTMQIGTIEVIGEGTKLPDSRDTDGRHIDLSNLVNARDDGRNNF